MEALYTIVDKGEENNYYHIAADEEYSVREIVEIIADIFGENYDDIADDKVVIYDKGIRDDFYDKKEVEELLNFSFFQRNLLITFHPETLKQEKNRSNFNQILAVLGDLENTGFIFIN